MAAKGLYDPGTDPSSGYGLRNTGIPGASTDHKGWDYPQRLGTPIHAAADGSVYYTGKAAGYGFVVVLKHVAPDGKTTFDTRYGHMNELPPLQLDQPVKKGDIIGYVGNNGVSRGPHLHYEIRTWDTITGTKIRGLNSIMPLAAKECICPVIIRLGESHLRLLATTWTIGSIAGSSR